MNLDAVAVDGAPGERDARLAQHAEHVVVDRLQPFLAHRAGIDLKQAGSNHPAGRGRARCGAAPNRANVRNNFSEKKFGTAKRHTASAVSKIATAFQRVKNNMERDIPRYRHTWRSVPTPASGARERENVSSRCLP